MFGGEKKKEIKSTCTSIVVRHEREKLGWLTIAVYNVQIKCIESSHQSSRDSANIQNIHWVFLPCVWHTARNEAWDINQA